MAGARRTILKDAILISVAVLALAAEVLFLLHQLRIIRLPLPWEGAAARGDSIGQVIEKRNSLKNRSARSLTWYPALAGDRIFLNDTLLTGSDASALVKIEGEGEIHIEADTLLKFSYSQAYDRNAVLNLELSQGIVRVKSQESSVKLKIKAREIALTPNTEVVVSKPGMGSQSQIQVKSGEVNVLDVPISPGSGGAGKEPASGGPLSIKAGEALQLGAERGMARIETSLKMIPKFPVAGSPVVAKDRIERIGFFWEGDSAPMVELSPDRDFSGPRQYRAQGHSAEVELVPGRYFWRLRRDVAVSNPEELVILPKITYAIAPADGSVFRVGGPVSLSWEPIEGASHYYVEVSASRDFRQAFVQSDVKNSRTEIDSLKPGEYYWRLRAKHKELGSWPSSPVSSFWVRRTLGAPKPKGAKILPPKPLRSEEEVTDE